MSERVTVVGTAVTGLFGVAVGVAGAAAAGLYRAKAPDALLSFLGNIAGAAIGAAATIAVAVWLASTQRRAEKEKAVEIALQKISALRKTAVNLGADLSDSSHDEFKRAIRSMSHEITDGDVTDADLRVALIGVYDKYDDISSMLHYSAVERINGREPPDQYPHPSIIVESLLRTIEIEVAKYRKTLGL